MMDIPRQQKILLQNKSSWMSERHSKLYGKPLKLVNLDQFNLLDFACYEAEEKNEFTLSFLADWKNELEKIELWNWSIKVQSELATNSNIPFFIIVGYEKELCFWIIPINKIAKELEWAQGWYNKWMSEKNYVKMMYLLRGLIAPTELLDRVSNKIPSNVTIKPNFQ